jgi:hypothetical protein
MYSPVGYKPGDQIGIQAKLKANIEVISQCLPWEWAKGPRWRAILVPEATATFCGVCQYLGFAVFERNLAKRGWNRKKLTHLPHPDGIQITQRIFKPFEGDHLTLPPVETDRPAGVPCPSALTPWRVKAIKLCNLLKKQGFLTSVDFKKAGVNFQRWPGMWLQQTAEKIEIEYNGKKSNVFKYVAKTGAVMPDMGWEDVAKKLEE